MKKIISGEKDLAKQLKTWWMGIIPNKRLLKRERVQDGNEGMNRQIIEPIINSGLIWTLYFPFCLIIPTCGSIRCACMYA